jgi:DNA repair exonuclease SbcCD ATPase subunit
MIFTDLSFKLSKDPKSKRSTDGIFLLPSELIPLQIQRLHDDYQHNLQTLQQEKIDLDDKIQKIHQDAVVTRDLFVSDIAQVLSESRNAKTLRMKVKDLQRKLHLAESYEADLKEMKRRVKELESSRGASVEDLSPSSPRDSTNPAPALGAAAAVSSLRKRPVKKFLFHLEDKLLLEIFAFLETQDVLRAAQVVVPSLLPLTAVAAVGVQVCLQKGGHFVWN